MEIKTLILVAVIFFLGACNRDNKQPVTNDKTILRFSIDANGGIAEPEVKEQVLSLAKHIEKSADKMMMYVYTEQSGNAEQDSMKAWEMARAVRNLMKTQGERNATGIGIDIRGYQNPVDSANPANIINRRIEIVPL